MHNFITIPSQGPLRCVVVKLKAHVVLSKRSQPQPLWLDGFMEQVEEDFWVINRDSPQRTQYQVWALEQFPSHWNIALWLLGNHKKMNGLSYTLSLCLSCILITVLTALCTVVHNINLSPLISLHLYLHPCPSIPIPFYPSVLLSCSFFLSLFPRLLVSLINAVCCILKRRQCAQSFFF